MAKHILLMNYGMIWMSNDMESYRVIEFTSEFKRNLRHLAKKYRKIRSDIQPIIDQLIQGSIVGEQIQGTLLNVYKVRARNSDAHRGKSGGYRIIYYLVTQAHVILLTIYSKTEQQDIENQTILSIIDQALATMNSEDDQ